MANSLLMKYSFLLMVLCFILQSASGMSQINDSIPKHDNFQVESKHLLETRTINVWIPPQYSISNESFPVLYMADGGIKEDFPHIANTVAFLIANKRIPPMILVGIENTDRHRDLTGASSVRSHSKWAPLTDGASVFRAFIKDELFSEINKRYRTNTEKGIIGESLAGLFVVETLLLKPEMFNWYIAFDPSLWWNNHFLVKNSKDYLSKFSTTDKWFWFASSDAKSIYKNTERLERVLKIASPKNLHWYYSKEPNEQHTTIFRATKEKALIWSFKH